jgi:hypothetical protein
MEEVMSKSEPYRDPTTCMRAVLQDGQVALDNGDWIAVEGYEKKTIEVIITGTATAQVFVSNAPTKPANNVDHVKYGNDISSSALAEIKVPVRWIKVKVSALTPGASVSAYMQGCP